ncbi:hypothetical protein KFZ76_00255 [Methylovulum psychrotolerans]|uniref:plasmid pRiA4b ORF-3 family protein n=1 Tax=Methylovulum psychrotolerans TaxID=1704499 RepID=UPI001BFFCA96|nr:plasmid pRiA4b ORF-3 family protein [Methylovulum psychrotolerans]MBT9096143.1 hypothetical protein [Methylovulum psychrotolerans]
MAKSPPLRNVHKVKIPPAQPEACKCEPLKALHLDVKDLRYTPGLLNLALMELFGFIQITLAPHLTGETWPIIGIEPSDWGRTFLNCLPEDAQGNPWHFAIKPHIPNWQRELREPEILALENGFCVFKVSLGKAYCKLAAPTSATLDDLAADILSAFAFDNDHLYEFIYTNRYGLEERVNHPYDNSDPCTEDFTVGELPLYKGMELAFHFDFGDDWWFKLVVETFAANDGRYPQISILEQHGTPPKQYRDWDEDE